MSEPCQDVRRLLFRLVESGFPDRFLLALQRPCLVEVFHNIYWDEWEYGCKPAHKTNLILFQERQDMKLFRTGRQFIA